jgi:predicted phosphodiesterase
MKQLAVVSLVLSLALGGCLRPAEERAERDRQVGHARVSGVTLDVEGGLAAVRQLEPTRALVWCSAPAIRLRVGLTTPVPASFELELWNAVSDSQLVAQSSGGSALGVEELPASLGTRKRYRIVPDGSSELVLDFGPPDRDQSGSFRFALMSDVQEAIDRVQDIYARMNRDRAIRFLLGAGDLTRQGHAEQLAEFERELEALLVPYYTTLGNHELGEDPPLYQDWFGRGSFHFAFRGVAFTLLDSASATIDPTVYDWLDGWLDQAARRVHVVAMHIAPLDPIGVRNGAFASRAEAAKLLSRLAEGRVDLTLYGHIHSYYAFENAGIPAYISGGGGAIPERFDGIGRHFLTIDIDGAQGVLDVRTVRVD